MNFINIGQFETGRTYDKAQVIGYNVTKLQPLELDMCLVKLQFTDKSRHIEGNIILYIDINISEQDFYAAILTAYDTGDYQDL